MIREKKIRFAFIGDVMIGGEYLPYVRQNKVNVLAPFERIRPLIEDVDMVFLNLEGPIYHGQNKRPKVTSLLDNDPAILQLFSNKVRVFGIANNHMMDYCEEGLSHTLALLRLSGIHYVGAGMNIMDANQSVIVECKGRRIGFLAFTSEEPFVGAVVAKEKSGGCANYLDIDRMLELVRKLKKDADIVCVSLHWGHEFYSYPSASQVDAARRLVDGGADYIIGHHPHVMQGIESYKHGLIMYSLGNFFLPPVRATSGRLQPRKSISKEFIIVTSDFSDNGITGYRAEGGRMMNNYTLSVYAGKRRATFKRKLSDLSVKLRLSDYEKFWHQYREMRERELNRENINEAILKLLRMPVSEIARTLSWNDIKRNVDRIVGVGTKKL